MTSRPFLLTNPNMWDHGEQGKFLQDNFLPLARIVKTIQELMVEGHINGNGFSLVENHWNPFRNANHHRLEFKIYATLIDLPLQCWMVDAVVGIISSFGVPHQDSRSSLNGEDLTSFDVIFFCEEFDDILEFVVIMGSHVFKVLIVIYDVLEQAPNFESSPTSS